MWVNVNLCWLLISFSQLSIVLADTDLSKCDPKLVEKIQRHWAATGGPPQIVASNHEPMTFIKGTESKFSKNAKCDYFYFTKSGKLSDLSKKHQEPLHECDGIITYANSKSYVISYHSGVYARYRCVDNGVEVSATNLPEVAIARTATAPQEYVDAATTVLTKMGLTIKPYNC